MFADEARFGRMNRIRPCWTPLGTRPAVAAQLIRQYIYLYGAVSPKDGTCVYLIMPTSNTASFQAFLQVLARRFVRQDILLVLDGGNHRCASNPAMSDRLTICNFQTPVRHTVSAILRPAYPPSAKMSSMNGNNRRARRSKWKAPSRS